MNRSDMMTAAGMGAMAGMRALSAPALMSQTMAEDGVDAEASPMEGLLASPITARVLPLLALGEMVMDKLPIAPERMLQPMLLMRVISGAVVGAAVAQRKDRPVLGFALVGAAASLVSSVALLAVRELATRKLRIPHLVTGLLEDMFVASAGRRLTAVLG